MELVSIELSAVVVHSELTRSTRSKVFEERLEASIDEIGLVEPIKVCTKPNGGYLVVDGVMRWSAISKIHARDSSRFNVVPAYLVDYERRFEVRYQTDIYQDLLPSQLAGLVEHLHKEENLNKADIARFIGVSPATLRNYTGLWRLLERGGLFLGVVDLMDVRVMPASNPYAWLRLTDHGLRYSIEHYLSEGEVAEEWIKARASEARCGTVPTYPLKYIESITGNLAPEHYREDQSVRSLKRELGFRKGGKAERSRRVSTRVKAHLDRLESESPDPVVRIAAQSISSFLR
jgi:ParB-like chromosome segregation protein Spo0J